MWTIVLTVILISILIKLGITKAGWWIYVAVVVAAVIVAVLVNRPERNKDDAATEKTETGSNPGVVVVTVEPQETLAEIKVNGKHGTYRDGAIIIVSLPTTKPERPNWEFKTAWLGYKSITYLKYPEKVMVENNCGNETYLTESHEPAEDLPDGGPCNRKMYYWSPHGGELRMSIHLK